MSADNSLVRRRCTGILLCVLRPRAETTIASKSLVGVLAFLVSVECLLLPVNYGVLISTQQLPRVTELGGDGRLPEGSRIWLVWESKDALTYFVRDPSDQRMLITVPRKDTSIRIVAYDDVFCELFAANPAGCRP